MYGIPGGKLDVFELLSDRNLARHLETNLTVKSYSSHEVQPTTKVLMHQVNEEAFVLTPKRRRLPVIRQFKTEQEYEGIVVTINLDDRTFTARLAAVKGDDADEEGEFSLDELNGDESLVVPGAIFTWTIGLQARGPSLQRVRVSDIRFRRLPPFTKEVIAKAEREAEELSAFLERTAIADPIIANL